MRSYHSRVQVKSKTDVAWEGYRGGREQRADSSYMLELEWTEAADGYDVKRMGERNAG